MKIGVIIPTRGNRPAFLDNCLRMMKHQTLQPYRIEVIDDEPISEHCDITHRYRTGYHRFKKDEVDLISFIEDDDAYSPIYLEHLARAWQHNGRPDLFGMNKTPYYHVRLRKWFYMHHDQRASAMATFIKPGMHFNWPVDTDPFTDQWLWLRNNIGIKNRLVIPYHTGLYCGIKHGMTITGGDMHSNKLHRYTIDSAEPLDALHLDPLSRLFYEDLSKASILSNQMFPTPQGYFGEY